MKPSNHLFSVKRPCKDCPFRNDEVMNISLCKNRMEEIINSLHEDKIFSCHKTIDYSKHDNDKDEHVLQPENKFCAGAMLYLIKEGSPNQPMQLGERFGMFNPSSLDGMEDIIDVIPMKMPWERAREAMSKQNKSTTLL